MMVECCVYTRVFTDERGGEQIGIARLATGLPFALAEAERWLADDLDRPCRVRCSAIPSRFRQIIERVVTSQE